MPGKHSPGYLAAYHRALRKAAALFRHRFPDQWTQLLEHELARRPQPDSDLPDDDDLPRPGHGGIQP